MASEWHNLDAKWGLPPSPPADMPIFLLGTSWRSGTTLVQRLLSAGREVLLWGEPYGDSDLIPSLCRTARVLLREEWPSAGHFPSPAVFEDLGSHWIANIYPELVHLRTGYRAMLDNLLQAPARARGFERFGLKEVRLGGEEARFLAWLYPDCRFLFLARNPWDAWASFKGVAWYFKYPHMPVYEVELFAKLWARNAAAFLSWGGEEGMLVRYEDLSASEEVLSELADHCRLRRIDPAPFAQRLRGTPKEAKDLTDAEVQTIRNICGSLTAHLGYAGPRETLPL